MLTMKADYAESPNLPVRSAETTSVQAGSLWITRGKELLVLGPGTIGTKDGDNNTTLHGSDLFIQSSDGKTSMDGSRIAVLGKSGHHTVGTVRRKLGRTVNPVPTSASIDNRAGNLGPGVWTFSLAPAPGASALNPHGPLPCPRSAWFPRREPWSWIRWLPTQKSKRFRAGFQTVTCNKMLPVRGPLAGGAGRPWSAWF